MKRDFHSSCGYCKQPAHGKVAGNGEGGISPHLSQERGLHIQPACQLPDVCPKPQCTVPALPHCRHPQFPRSRPVPQTSNAAEFVDAFELKYNTRAGDLGSQLSGGQKQRVAIARCVCKGQHASMCRLALSCSWVPTCSPGVPWRRLRSRAACRIDVHVRFHVTKQTPCYVTLSISVHLVCELQ